MTLSEAIRLGSMMNPQGFGAFYNPQDDSTCALGAAQRAGGGWRHEWAWTLKDVACPLHSHLIRTVTWTIEHLNDHHRWTREQIADWVETVERQQAAPQAPAHEAVTA